MYSSGYSHVSKSSPHAQKKMQYRSKGKSCGYYMRIVFFFSSLIQSLIIVSLVLFLVYGKSQDSASVSRIHDLEESFSRLSIENVFLRQQRKNLTNLLNTTLTEKARNDWDLVNLRYFSNISAILIQDMDRKMQQCYSELFLCKSSERYSSHCQPTLQLPDTCNCGLLVERLKARLELVESNFTQTTQRMRMELDQTAKERDNLNLEVIRLRRERSTHEKEVDFFRQKCKDDFTQSLSGISNVSKAFLDKISSLVPLHSPFHLTCPRQREHLEQIRTNCTSLSLEVEDKFQRYLNNVGTQVSKIQGENSRLKAENWRLSEDYRWCSTNRTGLILQNRQNLDKMQRKYDEEKERLLIDKMRLNGEIDVLKSNIKYKSREVDHMGEQLKQLNMSCMFKAAFGGGSASRPGTQSQPAWGLPSGGGSSSYGISQTSRVGSGGLGSNLGSYGSGINKPSTGAGSSSSSLFNSGSSSSSGSTYNKPSTGAGSSSSSLFNSGSSSSSGSTYNKPSTGAGSSSSSLFNSGSSSSSGSTYNKPSTGSSSSSSSLFSSGSSSSSGSTYNKPGSSSLSSGSSSSSGSSVSKPASTGGLFSSFGSSGSSSSSSGTANKPAVNTKVTSPLGTSSGSSGSSGIGANKPTTNLKTPTSPGSSSGSTGSTSKSGSSSLSWFGFGSSSSGQSKTGTGTGKGPSTGNSYGGSGSSLGAGRTSGGGSISVAQHLKDLQRLINPSGPE
ncbi:hypothetical protein ABVT39_011052 [Epinephelus coioides]